MVGLRLRTETEVKWGERRKCWTMWKPTNPQPPTTRTEPRGFGGDGDGDGGGDGDGSMDGDLRSLHHNFRLIRTVDAL